MATSRISTTPSQTGLGPLTFAPTWTPDVSCAVSNDLWRVQLDDADRGFYLLGAVTDTVGCAPPGWGQNVIYSATACPTGYTPACEADQIDTEDFADQSGVVVCCPTAWRFACNDVDGDYEYLTLWCGAYFEGTATTGLPINAVSPGATTVSEGGTSTYTLTGLDRINAFGVLYTGSATLTTPTWTPQRTYGASSSSSASGSGQPTTVGAAAGIGAGATAAFFLFVVLPTCYYVWRRKFRSREAPPKPVDPELPPAYSAADPNAPAIELTPVRQPGETSAPSSGGGLS